MVAPATVAAEIDIREKWPAIAMIGTATGLLSGLLGIGGAAILVPGMVDLLGISQHRATGTSLLAIIPTAVVSAIVYAMNGQMDWPMVALFSATAVLGAMLGARLTARISATSLRRMFGVFLLFVAIRLIVPGGTPSVDVPAPVDLMTQAAITTLAQGLLGMVAGFLSGLLGIGGGQVLTPGMIFFFDLPQRFAQGISIAFIVPTAASGAYTHYRRGNVLPKVGMLLMPCSIVGGLVGAMLAQVAPADNLRMGFGVFLVYAGTRMLAPQLLTRLFRSLGGARA